MWFWRRRAALNGYNFTDRVRHALQRAREEAARRQHAYVGTEHILLGLIGEGKGVVASVLATLHVDLERLRRKVDEMVKTGTARASAGPDLPYTSRAKKVLELAMQEARQLGHTYVGTEHVLLGLLGEVQGIAAQVLVGAGMDLETARAEVRRLLGSAAGREAVSAEGGPSEAFGEVLYEDGAVDEITLRGMRFHTLVGLLPHEQQVPQPLELDVTAYLSLRRVGETDSPKQLLDYRSLYGMVAETVGKSPHKLLEALCEKIAARVLDMDTVRRVRVAARKPHAPIPGPVDYVEVVIERRRDAD